MPRENPAKLAFNRGVIDIEALGRIDLAKVEFAAETQTNWMPRALGSMGLRPGMEYKRSTRNDSKAVHATLIYDRADTAVVELTNGVMRVEIAEAILTRPSVTTVVTNGTFTSDVANWTDSDDTGATSAWATGGYLSLVGTGYAAARRRQQVTVAVADQGTEHALRVEIFRGPVSIRVGSTSGGDEYIEEALLEEGSHSLAFTPTGDFHIELSAKTLYAALVDSIAVESSGAVEFTTPWAEADLPNLRLSPSDNEIYIACDGYRQRVISRLNADFPRSWSLTLYQPEDGPFRVINAGSIRLTPSAINGDITLSASDSFFRSGHAGGLIELTSIGQKVEADLTGEAQFTDYIRVTGVGAARAFDITRAGTWSATVTLQRSVGEPGSWSDVTTYTTNGTTSYNDSFDNQIMFYRLGIKTGNYTSGTAELTLQYANGGLTGRVRVTTVTNATSAAAVVLQSLGGTDGTELWSEGEWSDYRGWPTAVEIYEGRLWWFGRGKYWGSITDAYASFDAEEEGATAPISRAIGFGPVDKIRWAIGLQRLLSGTDSAEISARSTSFDEPLTVANFNLKAASTEGSANVPAVRIDTQAVFVQGSGQRVYMLSYSWDANDYVTQDLTELLPDFNNAGIARLAVQRKPDTRVHAIRNDGTVGMLLFHRPESIICWIEFETDGQVEDCFVLPGTEEDQVYYVVKRTIGGATKRYVERLAKLSDCIGGTLNKQADSFVEFTNSPASDTVSGLDHIEGKSAVVWADGKCLTDANGDIATFTVTSGAITLTNAGVSYNATTGIVGLAYRARYKSTKLAYAAGLGSPLLQRKRVDRLGLLMRYVHAKGITYGPDFDTMDDLPLVHEGEVIDPDTVHGVFDDDFIEFPGDWDTDSRVCLEANAPRPARVVALVMSMKTNDG